MQNYPKISIVTPSFNQGKYLEQTILSIIGQNYPNLEYIIIDGGSADNSVEIIKKYEKHLAYWVSEKDSGQSEAINKGLVKCTGEIFNWINSDDLLAEGSLFEVARCFTSKDIDVAVGYLTVFNDSSGEKVVHYRTFVSNDVAKTVVTTNISQASTFIKTAVVKYLGGVNTALHYTMDLELWVKYLLKYGTSRILLSDKNLANFRLHDASKSESEQPKFLVDKHRLFRSLLQQLEAPQFLLNFFGYLFTLPPYQQKWEIGANIDKNKIFIHFIDEYLRYLKVNWQVEYISIVKCVIYRLFLYTNRM